MTLCFSGNDYKYELEGVMKLFIPATLFNIVYEDRIPADDDFAFVRKKQYVRLKNRMASIISNTHRFSVYPCRIPFAVVEPILTDRTSLAMLRPVPTFTPPLVELDAVGSE